MVALIGFEEVPHASLLEKKENSWYSDVHNITMARLIATDKDNNIPFPPVHRTVQIGIEECIRYFNERSLITEHVVSFLRTFNILSYELPRQLHGG